MRGYPFRYPEAAALATRRAVSEIVGPYRDADLVAPRHAAMYLARLHRYKTVDIGAVFERDHSTVSHAVKSVERRLATPSTRAAAQSLLKQIEAAL